MDVTRNSSDSLLGLGKLGSNHLPPLGRGTPSLARKRSQGQGQASIHENPAEGRQSLL